MKTTNENILEFQNITKVFPGVKALDNASFTVKKGSVHAICGENGAGKSTLMKVINGLYKADEGTVIFDGKPLNVANPSEARAVGISMIYQELNIVPEMTVADNIYLGREPRNKSKLFVDNKQIMETTQEYLRTQNLDINPKAKMKELSMAQAQMIEIIKAISTNAKLILMDEPTSAITDVEVDYLFKKIAELKEQGVTIIYISHKMSEIFMIADYISIFRDGKHIETRSTLEFDTGSVISLMVGREMNEIYPIKDAIIGDKIFEVKNLSREGVFQNISFNVKKGEILGVAGLMGAGRTEIVRSIIGLDPYDSGELYFEDKQIKISNVDEATSIGIAMVSEDRRRYGFVAVRSVKENVVLPSLKHRFKSMWIKNKEEKQVASDMIKKLNIKTPTMNTEISTLSGGNQQKVVLAKWLLVSPKVLILDEPTRGIDVGAKYEIYKLMCKMAMDGISIIMISSELPELIGMSDRIIVISQGKLVGQLNRDEATPVNIMNLAIRGK